MWCCASAFPSSPWYPPQPNQLASGKPQRKEHWFGSTSDRVEQPSNAQCSYLLCPHIFRGVTPYRRDGESLSCMQGMACTFRLPAGPCTKEPPDRYRRMCHTPDAFTPGSALRHLSNDKATNGREWGALSCCVYQKGNNLSSKGQYTTTNKSYVVKLVII